MLNVSNVKVTGFDEAIRGMRNSWNSWEKSDSTTYEIGEKDLNLMVSLINEGASASKYRRLITVYADIKAPLYWWKQFDTYKVGTVSLSCSTMHTIMEEPFIKEDFSIEFLTNEKHNLNFINTNGALLSALDILDIIVGSLNMLRQKYLETNNPIYWREIIQLLPSSYLQKRTVMLNYEVLASIYKDRKHHKLFEWREFCDWIVGLPYSDIILTNISSR